ncbi:hypothetical protein QFC20_002596 [Naganishia adeliensis]|uniref:Uncharacterized protein n=1 Tax=Naganishia adeliensis TaxID=92952 RepID=A0ACC2WIZ5_9TREE|nr:hypothetical protein QFC20_002596 [Naganishia adeliensis]
MLSLLSVLVLTITVASALPTSQSITELQHVFPVVNSPTSTHPKRRPLVIWHGLGDTANSDGISGLVQDIKDMFPGIYIHTVATPAGGSVDDERRAGFYGNASSQVDAMAATIQDIPELQEGFDGIGFSQGGLFMRDYVQRYNVPPVSNLLTASYFRDHDRLDVFHKMNKYLTRLNGELEHQPEAARNIAGLQNLILVNFEQDQTVYPKESSTFGSLTPSQVNSSNPVIPLTDSPFLWAEDRIGLRTLAEKGHLRYGTANESCPGSHMDLQWGEKTGGITI